MSGRFNALVQRDLNGKGLDRPVPYSYATSLFYYRPGTGYRDITRRLKYHSDLSAGRYFAGMLGREMEVEEFDRLRREANPQLSLDLQ